MKSTKNVIIQGPAMTSMATMASILGMKVSVISLICVAACRIDTTQADHQGGQQHRRRQQDGDVEGLLRQGDDTLRIHVYRASWVVAVGMARRCD